PPDFDRPRIIGAGGPLNDVVMMLPPVQLSDIEWMRTSVAVERDHRRRAEIQVPIETGWGGARRTKPWRPENPSAIPIGVNLFERSNASAANELAGHAKLRAILAALLCARLVHPSVTFRRGENGLALANRDRR